VKKENTTRNKKMAWWVYLLIALLLVICSPILVPVLVIYFPIYWICSPFEKKNFRKSGYGKYHSYFFRITQTEQYKIYIMLTEQKISFEHIIDKEQGVAVYILQCNDRYIFILCDEEFGSNQSNFNVETAFAFLENFGELRYPQAQKDYFICLQKNDINHFEISKEEKEKLKIDNRIIEVADILTLI